jgi:hypothetical protein
MATKPNLYNQLNLQQLQEHHSVVCILLIINPKGRVSEVRKPLIQMLRLEFKRKPFLFCFNRVSVYRR